MVPFLTSQFLDRISVLENNLKNEALEMRTIGELTRKQATSEEVNLVLDNLHEAEEESDELLLRNKAATYSAAVKAELERQADPELGYEKDLLYVTENNAVALCLDVVKIKRSRVSVLSEVTLALKTKRDGIQFLLDEQKMPDYVKQLAINQIEDEMLRETCELKAAYTAFEASLYVAEAHRCAMVEGLYPSAQYAEEEFNCAHIKELNHLREAFNHDVLLSRRKCLVQQHKYREFESQRLMALGRSPDDLGPVFCNIDEAVAPKQAALQKLLEGEFTRTENSMCEQLSSRVALQRKYNEQVEKIQATFEDAKETERSAYESVRPVLYEEVLALREQQRQRLNSDKKQPSNVGDAEGPVDAADEELRLKEEKLLQVDSNFCQSIFKLVLKQENDLADAFKSCIELMISSGKMEDSLRSMKQIRQQTAEAQDNAIEAVTQSRIKSTLVNQLNRRDEANSRLAECEISLHGLENTLKNDREKKKMFLEAKLKKRKEERIRELAAKGMDATLADEEATKELKVDDERQRKELDSALQAESKKALKMDDSKAAELKAIVEKKSAVLKALQSDGLVQLQEEERERLEVELLRQMQTKEAELLSQGLSSAEAKAILDKEFTQQNNASRSALVAKQGAEKDHILQHFREDNDEEAKRREAAHEKGLSKLESNLEDSRQQQKKALEARIRTRRLERTNELVKTQRISQEDAERQSAEELQDQDTAEMASGLKDIDKVLSQQRENAIDKLQNAYDADIARLHRSQELAEAILLNGLEHVKSMEHKKLEDRVHQLKAGRRAQLASQGITDPTEIEAKLAEIEAADIDDLNALLNTQAQQTAAVTEEALDESAAAIIAAHEKKVKGLVAYLDREKSLAKSALQKKLERRKRAREVELRQQAKFDEADVRACVAEEYSADRIAATFHALETRIEGDNAKLIRLRKEEVSLATDLLNDYQKELKRKEDMESKQLVAQADKDLADMLDRSDHAAEGALRATRQAVLEAQSENDFDLKKLREQNERELVKLQEALLAKKEKERAALTERLARKQAQVAAEKKRLLTSADGDVKGLVPLTDSEKESKALELAADELAEETQREMSEFEKDFQKQEEELKAQKVREQQEKERELIEKQYELAQEVKKIKNEAKDSATKEVERLRKEQEEEMQKLEDSLASNRATKEKLLKSRLAERRAKKGSELELDIPTMDGKGRKMSMSSKQLADLGDIVKEEHAALLDFQREVRSINISLYYIYLLF